MKKVSFLLIASICFTTATITAQQYQTAFGAKFYTGNGSAGGINIRHSPTANTALEGTMLFFSGAIGL